MNWWKVIMHTAVLFMKGSMILMLMVFFLFFLQTEQWWGVFLVWGFALFFATLDSKSFAMIEQK